eukprot:14213647-Alexandrium_andersonii.AAC.1
MRAPTTDVRAAAHRDRRRALRERDRDKTLIESGCPTPRALGRGGVTLVAPIVVDDSDRAVLQHRLSDAPIRQQRQGRPAGRIAWLRE